MDSEPGMNQATAAARAQIYALLAAGFGEPSPELVHEWLSGAVAERIRQGFTSLGIALEPEAGAALEPPVPAPDLPTAVAELTVEYTRLFVGPGHLPCPPYESVYRTDAPALERGLLMGRAAAEVLQAYRQAGLNLDADYHDLPDHLATELEFMYFLCEQEMAVGKSPADVSTPGWRKQQSEFLRRHLSQWVPAFLGDLAQATTAPLYQGSAAVLRAFLVAEQVV